jgi:hypothetical protein
MVRSKPHIHQQVDFQREAFLEDGFMQDARFCRRRISAASSS